MSELLDFMARHLGNGGFCLLLLVLLAIYAWYERHKNSLLRERIEVEKARRETAAERFAQMGAQAAQVTEMLSIPAGSTGTASERRILIADDEEAIRNIIAEIIIQSVSNVSVAFASDGQETLEKLRYERFSLLVLDLIMPKVTGYDVLSAVSREIPALPILIVSGYWETRSQVAIRAGISMESCEFLHKPFEREDLVHIVRRLLR